MADADRKDDNIAKLRAMTSIEVRHIAEAMDQRLAAGDDISNQQRAVRHHRQLAVFDLKTCNLFLHKHTLTGEEADIMNADVLPVAALLERVV